MAEHIDFNRLRTDVQYRFEYISKFLNFTNNDISILHKIAPILFPVIPVITDHIYRKLFSFDVTKQFFFVRDDLSTGDLSTSDNEPLIDSVEISVRKDMLSMYLKRILTQTEWNDGFLHYLSRIAEIHGNLNSLESINVDYIHISLLFGYLENLVIDFIWKSETVDNKTKQLMIATVNKVFRIQNDFFIMHRFTFSRDASSASSETVKKTSRCCCSLY